ncbi:hypothetical protein B9G69_011070 [Bdellovibrio sp. SKB1291214]|uniref:hypothetical protein n=1 Tax=Bdellovibrio sp. SKB1291214 TaxID=1732569 RepID=UPI000B518438|nr:hypothetical protein [Bdellovibrio sp. SKB1291214]UYL07586.1 hypothetical protein B9G69_011070 [Bdellovibrio sp. SKB1291214]
MRLILSLIVLFHSCFAFAQANLASDVVTKRNTIENEVRRNLEDLISTRLERKTFNVAVRAQLSPIQPPKKEKEPEADKLPEGMDIGSIDVRNVVESYEKKIEEMKLKKEQAKEEKQFQISSLEVFVGLDTKAYPESYAKELNKWLQDRLTKDYGRVAKATVGKISQKIEKPKDPVPVKPEPPPETLAQQLRKWAPVIAAALLALALFIMGLLLRSGMTSIASAQKPLTIEQKGELALESTGNDALGGEAQEQLPAPVSRLASEELDMMIKKIAFVCMEIGARTNELIKVWIDANEEGFAKTALLVDCLITAREKIMKETGAMAALRIPIEQDMISNYEEHLAEAYRNVGMMDDPEKLQMLKGIYWDLISVRTLGIQSLRRPFDFLNQAAPSDVKELLDHQPDDTRALAMMYLPKETQSDLLTSMDEFNKLNTIRSMLLNAEVDVKKLWDHDTSVKVVVEAQQSKEQTRLVNLFPRTLEAIQTLTPVDEITTLRKVSPSLPMDGRNLKHNYLTLAFVDEWKPDYIRRLTQIATAEEVLNLIRVIPQAQYAILEQCPPMMKTILADDLKLSTKVDLNVQNQKVKALKAKWARLIQSENITIARIYVDRDMGGAANVA